MIEIDSLKQPIHINDIVRIISFAALNPIKIIEEEAYIPYVDENIIFSIKDNTSIEKIEFRNLTINGDLHKECEDKIIPFKLWFTNCDFKGSIFLKDFNIPDNDFCLNRSCSFYKDVNVVNSYFYSLDITNSNFCHALVIFSNCGFNSFNITYGKFLQLLLINITIYNYINIYDLETDDLEIINNCNIKSFGADKLKSKNCLIYDSLIGEIDISSLTDSHQKISISRVKTFSLKLHFVDDGILKISNAESLNNSINLQKKTLKQLHDKNQLNEEEFNSIKKANSKLSEDDFLFKFHIPKKVTETYCIQDGKGASHFKIYNSKMRNTEFYNFKCDSFDQVEIIGSNLSNLKTFNSTFSAKSLIGDDYSTYETFNELYTVAKDKNNKREQSEYYKAAHIAYYRHILKDGFWKNFSSISSLFVSKYASRFGTVWWQALLVTLGVSSIFFMLSIVCSSQYKLDICNGWPYFLDLIPFYFQSLIPTHGFDFLDDLHGKNLSGDLCFVLFNGLERILVSIGIFEIIRSFRKDVRS